MFVLLRYYERSNDKFGLLHTKEYDYMDKITVICYNTEAKQQLINMGVNPEIIKIAPQAYY